MNEANCPKDAGALLELPLMLELHYSPDIGMLTMRPIHHTRPCVTFTPEAAKYCGGAIEMDGEGYVVRCADEFMFVETVRQLSALLSINDQESAACQYLMCNTAFLNLRELARDYIKAFESHQITNSSGASGDVTGYLYDLAKAALIGANDWKDKDTASKS